MYVEVPVHLVWLRQGQLADWAGEHLDFNLQHTIEKFALHERWETIL